MFWKIPKMWEGGECWIIGGGPSIPQQFEVPEDVIKGVMSKELPMSAYSPFLSPIHGKHTIGINVAFMLGTWIDVLFFGDAGFYLKNRHELAAFPKLKVTCAAGLDGRCEAGGVKLVRKSRRHDYGITEEKDSVSWGNNSGAASISLAVRLGVKKIYLLGFDMNIGNGTQHFHSQYGAKSQPGIDRVFTRHLRCFPAIEADAKRMGIEIINVSPNSTIKAFPRVSLKEVL